MGLPIRESIKIDGRWFGRPIVLTVLLLDLHLQFLDRLLSLNQMVSLPFYNTSLNRCPS